MQGLQGSGFGQRASHIRIQRDSGILAVAVFIILGIRKKSDV